MDKQIVVHPCNEILLSNKKEQIVDTCKNMNKCKNIYAEWKKADKNTYYMIYWYKILKNANSSVVIESRSVVTWRLWEWITKGYKETFGCDGYVYCGDGFMSIVKTHQVVYAFIHV